MDSPSWRPGHGADCSRDTFPRRTCRPLAALQMLTLRWFSVEDKTTPICGLHSPCVPAVARIQTMLASGRAYTHACWSRCRVSVVPQHKRLPGHPQCPWRLWIDLVRLGYNQGFSLRRNAHRSSVTGTAGLTGQHERSLAGKLARSSPSHGAR